MGKTFGGKLVGESGCDGCDCNRTGRSIEAEKINMERERERVRNDLVREVGDN